MYLIKPEQLDGKINPYYTKFIDSHGVELIGYWPASEKFYFCADSEDGAVAPVFLIDTVHPDFHHWTNEKWLFDTEYSRQEKGEVIHGDWALFFLGCDDGHTGKRFATKEEALYWIAKCPEIDFKELVWPSDKTKDYKLEWHN